MAASPAPGIPKALWERLRRGASLLEDVDRVRILCHYDADGAASAAILSRALLRRGKDVHISLTTVLDDATAKRIAEEEGNEAFIVADMGSGQLDAIESFGAPAVVLDHHKPGRDTDAVVHANPHLFGIDGAHGACGATTSWAFALAVDGANWDAAGIAMAGAIADRQHVPAYDGLNAPLFEEAVRRGLLAKGRAPGLPDRPIGEALASSYLPYFAGFANRPDAVAKALKRASIDTDARWKDLDDKSRRALASYLATHLMRQGAIPEAVEMLVQDTYDVVGLDRSAGDLSDAVNACCRMGEEGVAVALALGDPGASERAEAHRRAYTEKILGYLTKLEEDGPFERKHLAFFYIDEPSLAGNVAGIAVQYLWSGARPLIAMSVTDSSTKVSARGTKTLVSKGLDLAAALREAASAVGGNGGGHDVASGATIPKGKEEKFVTLVDERVGLQLAPNAEA